METEVLVVGAGPAGSTAARELAEQGHDVLLLDRARFPRDKPCGGGVTVQGAGLLPFSLEPVVEQVVTGAVIRDRANRDAVHDGTAPLAFMTQRTRLDAFLVERAEAAGATFRDGARVRRIDRLPDGRYAVEAAGETHLARVVLGADGANGVTRTFLGYEHAHEHAVALEAAYPTPDGPPPWLRGRVLLQLGVVPGGYAWLFPKADHINVGLGGWKSVVGGDLRAQLDRFARNLDLDPALLVGLRGHHLPMRRPGALAGHAGSALLGDACGLVDPLSGEGIASAIRSAQIATPEVTRYLRGESDTLATYDAALRRDLLPELETAHALMELFHAFPRPCVWALQHSDGVWGAAVGLVRGERTYGELTGRFGPATRTLHPLAAMARRWTTRRYGRRFGKDE